MNDELNTKLISPGDTVVAAVSGGADSVALLGLLSDLVPILKFQLFVCHLNHQLRGEAADGDEGFVRALAAARHLPIYVERQDVKAIRGERGGSLEETARAVRYEFSARAAGCLSPALVRNLAREAGLTPLVENGSEVIVGAGLLGVVGTPVGGPQRVVLPKGYAIDTCITGQSYQVKDGILTFDLEPGDVYGDVAVFSVRGR